MSAVGASDTLGLVMKSSRILLTALIAAASSAAFARAQSCQSLVFSGLSSACALGGESASESACCDTLGRANERRCFCDIELMGTIEMVIGNDGIEFFRNFSKYSCDGGELVIGDACSGTPPASGPPQPQTPPTTTTTTMMTVNDYNRHRQSHGYEFSDDAMPTTPRERIPMFPPRAAPEEETVARWVLDPRRNAEVGFTADALSLTGVRNVLDGNASLTFFVPTNEAWYSLLFQLGVTKEELFCASTWLEDALRYHVVNGAARTSTFSFGTLLPTDLTGEDLSVETYTDGRGQAVVRVNGCSVHTSRNRRDVSVGDAGLVHFVDCVLLPPGRLLPTRRTIDQYIRSQRSLSMFANAMRGSSLFELLAEDKWFTVFAPSDDAFARFLRDPRIGMSFYVDDEDGSAHPSLTDVLTYHVAMGFHSKQKLSMSRAPKSLFTIDALEDSSASTHRRVYVSTRGSQSVLVNGCAIIGEQAFARNGVVHVIDCVLSPNFDSS